MHVDETISSRTVAVSGKAELRKSRDDTGQSKVPMARKRTQQLISVHQAGWLIIIVLVPTRLLGFLLFLLDGRLLWNWERGFGRIFHGCLDPNILQYTDPSTGETMVLFIPNRSRQP